MSLFEKLSVAALCGCLFLANPNVFAKTGTRTYEDEHVALSYPDNRYNSVKVDANSESNFYTYLLHLKDVDADDILTVCKGDIRQCGSYDGVKPYWYSEDGTLMLFSATTIVAPKKSMGIGRTAYEAFPACPTTDSRGRSHAYGAECYELVVSEKGKTVSLTYWIGEMPNRKSKVEAAKAATYILDSVKIK